MITKVKGRDAFSYYGTKPIPRPYPQNIYKVEEKEILFCVG